MDDIAFADAPPPTPLGSGHLLVPVHIIDLHASVKMDASLCRALVDATMTYVVGPTAGHPIFDLRQPVSRCWIDGVRVDPAVVASQSVGEPGRVSCVREIRRQQGAGSTHTLRLVYRIGTPRSDLRGAYPPQLSWQRGLRVRWSFGMADLYAGRYLEAWFPSNLPFDHFPLTLDLSIAETPIVHTVITNGRVTTTDTNHWSIGFPDWFTTMSPLLELHASDTIALATASVVLPISRRPVVVTACKPSLGRENLTTGVRHIAELLFEQERRFGEFTGDSYICFFHGATGGMEYANATTTSESALRHEVIHSWFARGVTPASQADGWWDEGFTRYLEVDDQPEPIDFGAPPVELCSRWPFQRTTSPRSYEAGSRVFRGIAAIIGPDRLIAAMKEFFRTYRGRSASTATLESFLIAATGAVSLVDVFHRFVYGFDDQTPEPGLLAEILNRDDARPARDASIDVRVRNLGPGLCRHFVIVVVIADEHPPRGELPIAAVAQFDLAPGRTRTVTLQLPRSAAAALPRRMDASAHAGGDRRRWELRADPAVQLRRRA